MVPPDLRHQLDAPEDGADGAEDGGGGRDGGLWGHCLSGIWVWRGSEGEEGGKGGREGRRVRVKGEGGGEKGG